MSSRQVFWLLGLVGVAVAASNCNEHLVCEEGETVESWVTICAESDPDHDTFPLCVEFAKDEPCVDPAGENYTHCICGLYREQLIRELEKDAGADGSSDAGESDAGSEADASTLMGNCAPNHPNFFTTPQPVWFGPIDDAPKKCPDEVGAFGGLDYLDMSQPKTEGCPECGCEPIEGSCSAQVSTIQFRAAPCDSLEAPTTDFNPPENWDGSCTNDHVIAAGAECPPGSGNPCVQSSYVSALPNPQQSCKPIKLPILTAITDPVKWKKVLLSCSPTYHEPVNAEKKSSHTCFQRPSGWSSCVHSTIKGEHDCSLAGEYSEPHIVYPEKGVRDDRSCSACECTAAGGACYGSVRYYEDEACSTLLVEEPLSSDTSVCDNFYPPDSAIGSKKMVDLVYVPGTCQATGGIPGGTVKEDPTDAVTWCCLAIESPLEPMVE